MTAPTTLDTSVEIHHKFVNTLTTRSPTSAKLRARQQDSSVLPPFINADAENTEGIFCTSWSPNDKLIASSTGDNKIILFRTSGEIEAVLDSKQDPLPITTLQWRPCCSKLLKTKQVLVSGDTSGNINYWHVPSKKIIQTIKEENEIYSLDYRSDGQKLASAGKDLKIRIYDEASGRCECVLEQAVMAHPGHSNRIFSVKFHPTIPHLIFSAAWDRCVHVWDIREKKSVKTIYGPFVCGESLVVQEDTIITGSWRKENSIETWDLGTGLRSRVFDWSVSPMVYSMKAHPKIPGILAVGGTGHNIVRVFDINSDFRSEIIFLPDRKGIYSVDFNSNGDFLCYAGNSSTVSLRRVNLPSSYNRKEEVVKDSDPFA